MHPSPVLPMMLAVSVLAAASAQATPVASVKHHARYRAAVPAARLRPAPPGSFTSLRVESYAELKDQVRRDPVVRRRYAQFFHLPESQVSSFVDHDLYPMRIGKTTHCVVYYVTPRGRFRSHPITLKPGTHVFALRRTGQPALNFVCGNGFLIPIKVGYVPVTDAGVSPSLEALSVPTEVSPTYDFSGQSFAASPVASALSPAVHSASRNLLPLAALGLLGLRTGHSHSNSTPLVPTASVPEPGAATLLIAGLPLLGLAVRRRKG